jgi:hypothetical protein
MGNTEKLGNGFLTTYDQSIDIRELMKLSVNDPAISGDITQERFNRLPSVGIRTVRLRVEPYLRIETGQQVVRRVVDAGRTLANLKDLASFVHQHRAEAQNWWWVFALSVDSRLTYCDNARVVFAHMQNSIFYTHWGFDDQVSSFSPMGSDRNGVLVVESE